jgi:hypothetical protein
MRRSDSTGYSAQRLLDRVDPATPQKIAEWRRHRPVSATLRDGTMLRDQKLMSPTTLLRCLDSGLQPEDWYEILNCKVFFWADCGRLNRQRLACGQPDQIVLTIDAAALLAT